jgi:glycerophosphoryl diester phosphodiesterase
VLVKFPGRDSYYVWDFTFAELSTLDAGSWYVGQLSLPFAVRLAFLQSLTDEELARFVSLKDRQLYASGAVKLPTLQQTLALAGSLDMAVNIEIKTQPWQLSELTAAVVKQVEHLQMEQQVLISSFAHEQLVNVRRLSKTIATGILTSARIDGLNDYLHVLDADAYHPNCYSGDAAASQTLNLYGFIPVREQGRRINAWTCNNKDDMRQLIAAGATSLISDFPNRVQEVLLGT